MSSSFNDLRKSKEEILKEFKEYKNTNKPDLEKLKNLLSHRNIVPEIIEAYLDILKNEDNNYFLKELFLYYQFFLLKFVKNLVSKKQNLKKINFSI